MLTRRTLADKDVRNELRNKSPGDAAPACAEQAVRGRSTAAYPAVSIEDQGAVFVVADIAEAGMEDV